MQHQTDKIIMDCSTPEEQDLADKFSRMEPGDQISGTFMATLDEFQNKIAILSIDEIKLKDELGVVEAGEEAGETPEQEKTEAASVALFKGGKTQV